MMSIEKEFCYYLFLTLYLENNFIAGPALAASIYCLSILFSSLKVSSYFVLTSFMRLLLFLEKLRDDFSLTGSSEILRDTKS